jgi:hypothetical protein
LSTHPPSASGLSASAFFGATVTVVAVVALEVAAGERLLPTLVLAGLATVAALLRILLAGRYRGLFAAVTCGLVMHPTLHLVAGAARPLTTDAALDLAHLLGSDLPVTVGQVIIAALIVAVVGSSEPGFLLAAAVIRRILRRLVAKPIWGIAQAVLPPAPWPVRRAPLWCRHVGRRGPPVIPGPIAA